MNPVVLFWLIRIGIALAAIGSLTAVYVGWEHHERGIGRAEVKAKWDQERAELKAQVQDQRDKNLALQRQAEKQYTVQAETRDRFITRIVTEIRYATQSLAACPVPDSAVRLLNDASRCASEDSAAACSAGDAVRPPG